MAQASVASYTMPNGSIATDPAEALASVLPPSRGSMATNVYAQAAWQERHNKQPGANCRTSQHKCTHRLHGKNATTSNLAPTADQVSTNVRTGCMARTPQHAAWRPTTDPGKQSILCVHTTAKRCCVLITIFLASPRKVPSQWVTAPRA